MKKIIRPLIIAGALGAAFALAYLSGTSAPGGAVANNYSFDPLNFPILLVHGLGEGPGAEAFGNLKGFLEDYYFKVYEFDFREYRGNKLAKGKDAGKLGTMAAVLGMKIKELKKQTNAGKVNIVAHSYGGLIVQAYMLNYGEEFSPKNGFYEEDVNKVVYLQTPFYGTTYNQGQLRKMAKETDFGPYTNPTIIARNMEMGSEEIFNMHSSLITDNIYDRDVDAITLVSRDDELLEEFNGTLGSFMIAGENRDFDSYVIFADYAHSPSSVDPEGTKSSLAWVEDFTDENFIAIASFLDEGENWHRISNYTLPNASLLMLNYLTEAGFGKSSGDEVTLTQMKKYKDGTVREIRKKGSTEPVMYFNKTSGVFVFSNLVPGKYKIKATNSKGKFAEKEFELEAGVPGTVVTYEYSPKDNKIMSPMGDAIFALDELVYVKDTMQEETWFPLPGLDINGFFVEWDSVYMPWIYSKEIQWCIYNGSGYGPDWRWNGGRLEFIHRWPSREGTITFHGCFDKNKDGRVFRDEGALEMMEIKCAEGWNWNQQHHVRFQLENRSDGWCYMTFWVDGIKVVNWSPEAVRHSWYYNPNPIVSFGGRFHDEEKYRNPKGGIIRNFRVGNLK
jgi:pimeloyl-ACP methyl ester carboxylesterase